LRHASPVSSFTEYGGIAFNYRDLSWPKLLATSAISTP
jgi:hypothetical protein